MNEVYGIKVNGNIVVTTTNLSYAQFIEKHYHESNQTEIMQLHQIDTIDDMNLYMNSLNLLDINLNEYLEKLKDARQFILNYVTLKFNTKPDEVSVFIITAQGIADNEYVDQYLKSFVDMMQYSCSFCHYYLGNQKLQLLEDIQYMILKYGFHDLQDVLKTFIKMNENYTFIYTPNNISELISYEERIN